MQTNFYSATILLLLLTDPLGNIVLLVSALAGVAPKRRPWVIVREVMIAFGVLLAFLLAGAGFMKTMQLSDVSLRIAGAIVLFLVALRMIFSAPETGVALPRGEPFIVPIAVPAMAGPSAMATVMLLQAQAPDRTLEWVAALTVTMLICGIVLLLAERIRSLLGDRVVMAFERLMGLILVAISVEMLLCGIRDYVHTFTAG